MLKNGSTFFAKKLIKFNNNVLKIYTEFIDFLYPPVCGICGKINKNWLCDNCSQRIKKFEIFKNIIIRKKYFNFKSYRNEIYKNEITNYKRFHNKKNRKDYKKEIQLEKIFFDEFIYVFKYSGMMRKLILKYKFNDCAYLYHFFSRIILNKENSCRKIKNYDIIIPVPMYEKKKAERGYNQTELIAREIALELDIKLEKECIQKIRNTKTQSTLSKIERKQNIKKSFFVNNKIEIKDKKIIVFDDIYTTGETVNELSRVLKLAGAKEILVFVIAKD